MKYYLVIRETLGEVIVCAIEARSERDAYELVTHAFVNSSGCYFKFEITEEAFTSYTYYKMFIDSKYEYSGSNISQEGFYLSGSGKVYPIVTGKLRLDNIFKGECGLNRG